VVRLVSGNNVQHCQLVLSAPQVLGSSSSCSISYHLPSHTISLLPVSSASQVLGSSRPPRVRSSTWLLSYSDPLLLSSSPPSPQVLLRSHLQPDPHSIIPQCSGEQVQCQADASHCIFRVPAAWVGSSSLGASATGETIETIDGLIRDRKN
jgi:hypothetical protein